MKTCTKCSQSLAESEFYKGTKNTCRQCVRICSCMRHNKCPYDEAVARCKNSDERAALKKSGHWRCVRCKQVQPFTNFFRYRTGEISYCNICRKEYARDLHQRGRAADFTLPHYRNAKSRSPRLGVPFNLPRNYLSELFKSQNGRCALTGLDMLTDGTKGAFTASVDRIVPAKGYTVGNVRWVCLSVNIGMREWGSDVFKVIAEAFVKHHG